MSGRGAARVLLAAALAGLTIWALGRQAGRPWKEYRRRYLLAKAAELEGRLSRARTTAELLRLRRALAVARAARPSVVEVQPSLGTGVERCLTCHSGIEEISRSHPVKTFGCVICHGGDGRALDKDRAHLGLRGGNNPSNLRQVELSCGGRDCRCHQGPVEQQRNHISRVKRTIMATKAGEWAELRFAFGMQPGRTALFGVVGVSGAASAIAALPGSLKQLLPLPLAGAGDLPRDRKGQPLPAGFDGRPVGFSGKPQDTKLRRNCAVACHLWTSDRSPRRIRAGGCASCHMVRTDGRYGGGDPTIRGQGPNRVGRHRFVLSPPYRVCNRCHNRGIHVPRSLTFVPRQDRRGRGAAYRASMYLPGSRFARCEVLLDCVDCHTPLEVMGDGHIYGNKLQQQYTRCRDCHGTVKLAPRTGPVPKRRSPGGRLIFLSRQPPFKPGDRTVYTSRGEPLTNVFKRGNRVYLWMKVARRMVRVPLVKGSKCKQQPGKQRADACHDCHTVKGRRRP